LVDEFQDTNRLQLELVLLLAEKRGGARTPVSRAFESQHQEIISLRQEEGFLAVVGDRKQSIYEFRGADVSVFEVMARAIEANGGGRAYLRHSRRSTGPLLEVLNTGFKQVLGPAAAATPPNDFEVVYVPEHDDLAAVRAVAPAGPPVVQLVDARLGGDKIPADQMRAADAEACARAIGAGLAGTWTVMEKDVERPARGGDVAMLFQRFTQLELYRQALVRHGVRHRVVRGRGFYGAQEIVDLASLLAVLADPDDALSLSAVLRSPLVGLTDSEWVALAAPKQGRRWQLKAREVLEASGLSEPVEDRPEEQHAGPPSPRPSPPQGEGEGAGRLNEFRRRYSALREERDRLGLRGLLRVVLEVFDYRVAVAAGPFGEQALANLDKLLVLATAREARGVGVAAFAKELLALADEAPREAQGEVVDELDLDAVTLCTVHQAKGLEWPIVVLPDLPTQLRNETGSVRFDRTLGLGVVRPAALEMKSFSAQRIYEQLMRRARAESLRLLYVAMTRARDRVVLGLRAPNCPDKTWANDCSAFFPIRVSGDRPEVVDVSKLEHRRKEAPAPSIDALDEVKSLLETLRAPKPTVTAAMVLPVTQLQDLVSCPRRFHFLHQVGLSERPGLRVFSDAEDTDDDVRARGTAAHKLLELTPLNVVGTPELGATLRELRRTSGLDRVAGDDVLGWVERFWASDFGRSLPSRLVHRELPFALRLGEPGGTTLLVRGQIDLLVITPDELIVVDYKTSTIPPSGLESYRFQLGCYALAAQRFAGKLPIRAGIVFLREEALEPLFVAALDPESLGTSLVTESRGLVEAQRTGEWPGRDRSRCDALGCGYVYRCHP
ncbi:MAG TPA: PD-(D/E)XK nuclease family protein, partial [Archangium sp.]